MQFHNSVVNLEERIFQNTNNNISSLTATKEAFDKAFEQIATDAVSEKIFIKSQYL